MKTNVFRQVSTIIIALLAVAVNIGFAQSTFNTNNNTGWSTGSTWIGGSAPGNNGGHTANVNHNVSTPGTLAGFALVTINGGRTLTSGSVGTPQNLTLQNITNFNLVNGNLTVYGNLTLSNGTTLTITSGTLTVTGTLTFTGGSTINNNGGVISAGAVSSSGAGGTVNINNGGSMSVTNALTLGSGGAVNVASGGSATVGSFTSSNNTTAVLNNSGSFTVNGNASVGGLINNNSTGTLQINGNYVGSGSNSAVLTSSGILNVSGNMSLTGSSRLQVNPHANSMVVVDGSVTVGGNENLTIGTAVAPAPYASMAIRGNLVQTGSGDVRVRQNGRLAVFGNVTDSGGGDSRLTIENGGQMYVHGNIAYTGNGSPISNANTTSPYGLYVNGTTTNTGGGSTTTGNKTDLPTLIATNVPFYNWLQGIPNGPMPVTLIYFAVKNYTSAGVLLGWATATEKDFHYFAIEKSNDGKEFYEVGTVEGSGNSKVRRDYTFEDIQFTTGRIYYRLKAVDYNGAYEYFKVITAAIEAKNTIDIFPNPSAGACINIRINFDPSSDARIEIYDNSGLKLMNGVIMGPSQELMFPTTLKPGAYMARYISHEHSENLRFIVR
jgi:hypothetical protein